jgi:DNA-binding transcriptional MerR regulator
MTTMTTTNKIQIPDRLYFKIGDVADLIGVKPYVLRYWEAEFPMISPQKSPSGQRVYRRSDVETVIMIKHLLYEERYSIEGARKRIRELRKEGELKEFKGETVEVATTLPSESAFSEAIISIENSEDTVVAPPNGPTQEDKDELRTLVHELRVLTQTSITKLFLY